MSDESDAIRASRLDETAVRAATRQNRINMLWEYVQAFLAVSLVAATIYASLRIAPSANGDVFVSVPETLKSATFIVLGFYFGRTNHTRPTPLDRDAS